MVGFRDLQWRRRRFLVGVAAVALVFAITLLLSGISASLNNETRRTVGSFGVDAWLVPRGVTGPFTSTETIPAAVAAAVRSEPGVANASPLVLFRETARVPAVTDLNVIGYVPKALGAPAVRSGRTVRRDGEIVVNSTVPRHLGDVLRMGRREFRVVGITHGIAYTAGTPAAFVTLHDAQQLLFQGAPLATTIVTRGFPKRVPKGLVALDNARVRADLGGLVSMAATTIHFLDVLLWAIAAGIIAAILYMSVLERVRDFAVMKATGCSNRFVMVGMAAQALTVAVGSALAGIAIAFALAPLAPMPVEVPGSAYELLFVVAIVIGLIASLAGLRRAVAVDPAVAFAG